MAADTRYMGRPPVFNDVRLGQSGASLFKYLSVQSTLGRKTVRERSLERRLRGERKVSSKTRKSPHDSCSSGWPWTHALCLSGRHIWCVGAMSKRYEPDASTRVPVATNHGPSNLLSTCCGLCGLDVLIRRWESTSLDTQK